MCSLTRIEVDPDGVDVVCCAALHDEGGGTKSAIVLYNLECENISFVIDVEAIHELTRGFDSVGSECSVESHANCEWQLAYYQYPFFRKGSECIRLRTQTAEDCGKWLALLSEFTGLQIMGQAKAPSVSRPASSRQRSSTPEATSGTPPPAGSLERSSSSSPREPAETPSLALTDSSTEADYGAAAAHNSTPVAPRAAAGSSSMKRTASPRLSVVSSMAANRRNPEFCVAQKSVLLSGTVPPSPQPDAFVSAYVASRGPGLGADGSQAKALRRPYATSAEEEEEEQGEDESPAGRAAIDFDAGEEESCRVRGDWSSSNAGSVTGAYALDPSMAATPTEAAEAAAAWRASRATDEQHSGTPPWHDGDDAGGSLQPSPPPSEIDDADVLDVSFARRGRPLQPRRLQTLSAIDSLQSVDMQAMSPQRRERLYQLRDHLNQLKRARNRRMRDSML